MGDGSAERGYNGECNPRRPMRTGRSGEACLSGRTERDGEALPVPGGWARWRSLACSGGMMQDGEALPVRRDTAGDEACSAFSEIRKTQEGNGAAYAVVRDTNLHGAGGKAGGDDPPHRAGRMHRRMLCAIF